MSQLSSTEIYQQAVRLAPLLFAYLGYRSLSLYPGAPGVLGCVGWALFAVAVFSWPNMFGSRQEAPAPAIAKKRNYLAHMTIAISLTLIVISVFLWSRKL